jgi:two-component system, NarL family, response regulator DesR
MIRVLVAEDMLDIDLPGLDGLTAAAELHERMLACPVVILTVLGHPGQLRACRPSWSRMPRRTS